MKVLVANVKDRANELRLRREEARAGLRALGAHDDTPLLQSVERSADDIDALLAEVDRLVSMRNAVIGLLRADGFTVLEPEFDVPAADEPPASDGDTSWRGEDEATGQEAPLPETTPASYRPLPPGSLGSGDYGPDSFGGQDVPHAPAVAATPPKQPSLFEEPEAPKPHRGAFVVVCGEGPNAGRFAMLHEERGNSWTAELLSRSVTLTKAIPMNASALILDAFPDPDAAKPAEPSPPAAEAPAAPKARTPEKAILLAEWKPEPKDLASMATRLGAGVTPEMVTRAIGRYATTRKPDELQARWVVPFMGWAKANPSAVTSEHWTAPKP